VIILLRRIGRWTAGLVLISVGLALSIPGIPGPGVLVVLLGVLVLLPESRWLRKRYARLKRKHPRVFSVLERYRRRRRRPGGTGPSGRT
jgi:hypothetical protein